MAARRGTAQGLTDDEVAGLRRQLDEGKRPRVHLTGTQLPAGSSGTVSRIGDPGVDGADFISVRVKVNGVSDELPFAPAELSLRRPPAPKAPQAAAAAAAPPAPTPAAEPVRPAAEPVRPAADSSAIATKAAAPAKAAKPAAGPAKAAAPAGKGAGRRKPAGPKVTLTISSLGATWSLNATRGPKGIAKNVPISPGVVTAIADLLGQAGIVEAVADINETAWAEAQARADQLRAQLGELEAVLAAHRAP